jgi:ATP-dependent DNA helicase RecG
MKIADISRDKDILKAARDIAQQTLDEDPELEKSEHAVVKAELKRILLSRPNWSRIS